MEIGNNKTTFQDYLKEKLDNRSKEISITSIQIVFREL